MNFKKDYYTILGVSRECSKEELKAAYRHLAKKYHPDRMPDADPHQMQEINEAYEVLSNPEKKSIYDAYYDSLHQNQSKRDREKVNRNIRRYDRKFTVTETEKVYLRGKLRVKFCADALESETAYARMADYLLTPIDTVVIVNESDLDIRQPSGAFQESIQVAELFRSPLQQPIRCELHRKDNVEYFLLNLSDIRVANIELVDITKHDQQSFGTLLADVFAELIHERSFEQTEEVTECFGPTGRVEHKQENGWKWKRQEYYYANCSTYWSEWEQTSGILKERTETGYATGSRSTGATWFRNYQSEWNRVRRQRPRKTVDFSSLGCSLFLGILCIAALFAFIPALRAFLGGYLLLLVVMWLGGSVLSWFGRYIPYLLLLLMAGILIAGFGSGFGKRASPGFVPPKPAYDTLVTQTELRRSDGPDSAGGYSFDTLISHTIRWTDYDSSLYEVTIPLRKSQLRYSNKQHQWLAATNPKSLAQVYFEMDRYDQVGLDLTYAAFDSLRRVNRLTDLQLANALVSCVQSIPYYLVVDQTCQPSQYADEFINSYLAKCNDECCVGEVAFGVRSPIEFLSDLKGDCDTRSLFLYSLLRRFNFDVALITSEHYRHAAIAVGFTQPIAEGSSVIKIREKTFYAWETTARGFQAGQLPTGVSQLRYWRVSLLNE